MKFSELAPTQRTLLSALATAQGTTLTTDRLAACLTGAERGNCQAAAHRLCAMRDAGLIFSHQKKSTEPYCRWQISLLGLALFEGRPDGNVVMVPPGASVVDTEEPRAKRPAEAPGKLYRVVNATGTCVESLVTNDEPEALAVLSRIAESAPGHEFRLVTTVAVALLPKPQATITRV